MKSHKSVTIPTLLGTLLSIALFSLFIVGCGSSTSTGATPVIQNTQVSTTVQKCGAIGVMRTSASANLPGNTSSSGSVKSNGAGNCFWQAFQQCRPASLTVNIGSIDTVTIHTFTLQKKDADCTISDVVQHRIIPRPAINAGTYTCAGLVSTATELHFNGCGTLGDIVVPTNSVGNSQ